VIRGLAANPTMARRGLLARALYSLPRSKVGSRLVGPPAVPAGVRSAYEKVVTALWEMPGGVGADGKPAPNILRFGRLADEALRDLERRLEPRLAEGEDLSHLAGWANKLAGAVARVAGVLHAAEAVSTGQSWSAPVHVATVNAAVELGEEYLLPHALAAFALLGADERLEQARHLWQAVVRNVGSEGSECSECGVTRRDLHQWVRTRQQYQRAEEIDPVIQVLVDHYYLRPVPGAGAAGRGNASPRYDVNPRALAAARRVA
jgi:hypothetical protein